MTAEERKERPIFSGVIKYFPDALMEVARVSYVGNEQHHPGTPLHWDKSKSTDEYDALMRHLAEVGTLDIDGQRHSAKVAWRALAALQRELDAEKQKPQLEMGKIYHGIESQPPGVSDVYGMMQADCKTGQAIRGSK